jgi:3-oxoacyl-[acyl-carrier protein] reductase
MKSILVTGASQGLGAAIAKVLATDGVRIFVNCSRSIDKAAAVVEEIAAAGGTAEVLQADVSDPDTIASMFEMFASRGGLDVLINNARVDPYKRPEEITDADWFDRVMGVNVKGPYLCSLAAIEQMKPKGCGRIVNVSSVWAYRSANRVMMEYAMSKAAMHSLTRSLAGIAGPFGITVNTVAPGLIITDELENRWTQEKLESVNATIPVRRGATPEEVVDVVRFAIDNPYLNGEIININGGVYMP